MKLQQQYASFQDYKRKAAILAGISNYCAFWSGLGPAEKFLRVVYLIVAVVGLFLSVSALLCGDESLRNCLPRQHNQFSSYTNWCTVVLAFLTLAATSLERIPISSVGAVPAPSNS